MTTMMEKEKYIEKEPSVFLHHTQKGFQRGIPGIKGESAVASSAGCQEHAANHAIGLCSSEVTRRRFRP